MSVVTVVIWYQVKWTQEHTTSAFLPPIILSPFAEAPVHFCWMDASFLVIMLIDNNEQMFYNTNTFNTLPILFAKCQNMV